RRVLFRSCRLEIYLTQANELLAANNAHAAWESLAAATPLAPDDVELNQRKAALAPRVANFVGRLDRAARYEDDGQHAASLTQYLAAQAIYPASSLARTGLERVAKYLPADLTLEPASATPPASEPAQSAAPPWSAPLRGAFAGSPKAGCPRNKLRSSVVVQRRVSTQPSAFPCRRVDRALTLSPHLSPHSRRHRPASHIHTLMQYRNILLLPLAL